MATRGLAAMAGLTRMVPSHTAERPRAMMPVCLSRAAKSMPLRGPRYCQAMQSGMGMDVLSREDVDQRVFVIVYKSTLWGLHVDCKETDGCRKTQVVVFQRREDAELMAKRLWGHRLATHDWPNTVLEGRPLWIRTSDDILMISPSPLKIDEIELPWIIERMAKSDAAVSMAEPFADPEDLTMRGRYLQSTASNNEKTEWLRQMHRRQMPARD